MRSACEQGQTAAEYLGLLVVVGVLLAGVVWGLGGGRAAGGAVAARAESTRARVLDHIGELERERAALREGGGEGVVGPLAWRPTVGGLRPVLGQLFDLPEAPLTRRVAVGELDERIARLRRWVAQDRVLLDFGGEGRVVEVLGDVPLAEAEHVAVLVPGVWNDLGNYDQTLRRQAANLQAAMADREGAAVATVVWLGYDTPDAAVTWGAATGDVAVDAGEDLAELVAWLDAAAGRGQHQTLIGHSYGSLVVAEALARGAAVDDAVMIGSPGVRRDAVDDLATVAEVWAARDNLDGIRLVPNLRIGPVGHGRDPTDAEFGAHRFATGSAVGHSGYFTPGTAALSNLAAIVTGHDDEVTAP